VNSRPRAHLPHAQSTLVRQSYLGNLQHLNPFPSPKSLRSRNPAMAIYMEQGGSAGSKGVWARVPGLTAVAGHKGRAQVGLQGMAHLRPLTYCVCGLNRYTPSSRPESSPGSPSCPA
jgi:hypothetical protein